MHLILLHGATGRWDELVGRVGLVTAIMGVILAILRAKGDAPDEADDTGGGEDVAADTPLVPALPVAGLGPEE